MIRIEKPFIEYDGNYAILNTFISIDKKREKLWFKVDHKFGQYLCDERGDAYLVAVLHYAMTHGHDIEVEAPVTEDLLYNIDTYLIDGLVCYNADYYRTHIKADVASLPLPNVGAVGTGISCGVDSLYALARESNPLFPNHKITHLTFNNVGSHGEGDKARALYQKRLQRPQKFAEEYGYEFVASDSNLMDVIQQSHFYTHTYSSMFPILCLQKLYSVYYYASAGYRYDEFTLEARERRCCGTYELLSLPVFSTHQLRIYSQGENLTRMQKLKIVAGYAPSYKYLNVCLMDGDNCGRCEKCVRTMIGLDALGKLELYRKVFDIDYYFSHKDWYMKQMLKQMAQNKHDYFEIYKYKKKDMTIPLYIHKYSYKVAYAGIRIAYNTGIINLAKKILKR